MTDFIEVVEVYLDVVQPDATTTRVSVGRHRLTETGRREMAVLVAEVPDMDGTLAGKMRSSYEVQLVVKAHGEASYRVPFSGTITDVSASANEADVLEVVAHDYWKNLAKHRVTMRRTNVDAGAFLVEALAGSAVSTAGVPNPYGVTLELISADYQQALSLVQEVLDRVDADAYIDDDAVLHVFDRASVASGLTVTGDGSGTIRPKFTETDQQQVTRLRGFGGQGYSEFHAQLTQGALPTVTNSSGTFLKQRVDFPRPQLGRVVLKLERVSGGTANLEVALQNDLGGVPSGTDVVTAYVPYASQPASVGEVTVDFPDHFVADVKPWVIIRASDATGVKVGVHSGGDLRPYAKAYYKFPVIVEVEADPAVIAQYGYLDGELRNPEVTSRGEMLELCKAELVRRQLPLKTGTFSPVDPAWLDAEVGTTVTVTAPLIGTTAETWAISRKEHAFNGGGVWGLTVVIVKVTEPAGLGDLQRAFDDRIRRLERKLVPSLNGDVTRLATFTDSGAGSDGATATAITTPFTWGTSKWGYAEWD